MTFAAIHLATAIERTPSRSNRQSEDPKKRQSRKTETKKKKMNNFSIWEQLPAEGPSAFCGQTPNTQADFYIIRGYFRTYMIPETIDISIVWHHAPPGYVYNDKRAGIIAGMTVVMLIMIGITTARLLARILGKNTVFGLDDYVIIPAAVRPDNQTLQIVCSTDQ